MSEQVWSTERVPKGERFHYWHEVVWDAFVPVAMTRERDKPFHGSVAALRVGPIAVARIQSAGQGVYRTAAEIARRAGGVYFLNFPLSAGTSAAQDGRRAILRPGDFALVDSTRPFELEFSESFDQISLMIPHELLAPRLADPLSITGQAVSGESGVGRLVGDFMRSVESMSGTLDRAAGRSVAEHLAGLLALALGQSHGASRRMSTNLLTQAILDEIERNLGDAELSVGLVASRVGISTRYLHRLLQDRGPSFRELVLERRIERCHADLTNPALADHTVLEIALANGFRDPSYLARVFRRRYGVAPTSVRPATKKGGRPEAASP